MNTVLKSLLALSVAALTLQVQAAPYQSIVPAKSSITFQFKQMGVSADGRKSTLTRPRPNKAKPVSRSSWPAWTLARAKPIRKS